MSMNKARELLDWLDRASVSIYAAVEETAARDITEQFKIIAQTIRDLIAENEYLKNPPACAYCDRAINPDDKWYWLLSKTRAVHVDCTKAKEP